MTRLPSAPASEPFDTLLAYSLANQPPRNEASFRRLVSLKGRLGSLSALCFLLYQPEAGNHSAGGSSACPLPAKPGIHRFILHTAPALLGQLNRTTQAQRVTLHGRTRGKVDWSATYKARYSLDSNPTVFVCLQSWRRFDRPENQLFVYLLHVMQGCLERLPAWLWGWQAWGEAMQQEGEAGEPLPLRLGDFLALLAHRLRLYRGHVSLQEIPIPAAITSWHLQAALATRDELYRELADLYTLYQKVVGSPDWQGWSWALRHTLPLPPSASEIGKYLREENL